MALPTIPNCYRVTWNFFTYNGLTPRIVQHFLTASADVTEIGTAIWEATANGMFEVMNPNFEPTSLSILPLDGTSATHLVSKPGSVTTTLCESGGESMPAVAMILSLKTNLRGPAHRGRSFIGPASESTFTDGFFNSTPRDDTTEAWSTFLANLGSSDPSIGLAVASYKHETATPVTNFNVESVAGTQRRRQNQLR